MKKETAKKNKVVEGKLIAEKDITLPDGQSVKVKLVDCTEPKTPKVPKAAWGTAEFADEFNYFEAPKALQARVRKVLDKSVTDLIDTVETMGSCGACAVEFWNRMVHLGELDRLVKPVARLAIVNAKAAIDTLGINLLVAVRELVSVNLKAEWTKKDTKKKAKKAEKPTAKKGE